MSDKCHLCFEPMDAARATVTFEGFDKLALNGVTFVVHARCLRFEPTDRGIELPERISEPVAEPNLVSVTTEDGGWSVDCRECGEMVALKEEREDAEIVAALHIARRHAA